MTPSAAVGVAPKGPTAKCTIKGTARSETLKGTNKKDVICARGGNDRVLARGNDDVVYGGAGDDQIRTSWGSDVLVGGDGDDLLAGEKDGDDLFGGPGVDVLDGGAGSNFCDTSDASDIADTTCVIAFSAKSLSFTPPAVDTSSGAQHVQMTIVLEKTEQWAPTLQRIYVNEERRFGQPDFGNLANPTNIGYLSLTAGTPEAGTWSGTITFPQGTPVGPHSVSLLFVEALGGGPGGVMPGFELLSASDLLHAHLPFFVFDTA
jgi:Ca2+-binding RTX toxin-like protein